VDGKASWRRNVGERLRAVRIAAAYRTARDFASEANVTENRLTSWERGTRLIPPYELGIVRRLTGATADFVYYGDVAGLPESLRRKLGCP